MAKKIKTNAEIAAETLILEASKTGLDISVYFQDWLQWLVEVFSLENLLKANGDYSKLLSAENLGNEVWAKCLALWVKTANEWQQRHVCVDFFGDVYEWCFQSKGKAARMQQYFTPYTIGSLMSRCLGRQEGEDGAIYCSEPSCGSGRNLLALWQDSDWNRRHVFYAEDLDPVSVKMCALNMMINGMFGYVVCHNTLLPDDFIFGYAVNEVRDPMPCDYLSIRQISKEEFEKINPWECWRTEKEKNIKEKFKTSLFDE